MAADDSTTARSASPSPCLMCGKVSTKERKFCSRECQWQSMRTRPMLVCRGCGGQFLKRSRGGKDAQLYCSRGCGLKRLYASKAEKKKAEKAREKARRRTRRGLDQVRRCATCSAEFTPRSTEHRFCSATCRSVVEALLLRPERSCERCGKAFTAAYGDKRRTFCSRRCSRAAHREVGGKSDRSRARKAGVEYEKVDRLIVFERDGWRCQCCGTATPKKFKGTTRANAPELDHRVPLAMGGPHTYDNVQLACRKCNRDKGGKRVVGQIPLFARPVPGIGASLKN